jgi:hypothetical protein
MWRIALGILEEIRTNGMFFFERFATATFSASEGTRYLFINVPSMSVKAIFRDI